MENNLKKLEQTIGYQFTAKSLLEQAMTHSSYANETKKGSHENNERLEFLGDAVLDMVVSEYMYRHFPKMPEGELTKLRAAVVCEGSLAELSRKLGVGRCLLLGKGEESTGGRSRDSILADAFEAIIGAICMDGGMEAAEHHIMRFIPKNLEQRESLGFRDYKTALQEVIQKNPEEKVEYVLVSESGPDHAKAFQVEVCLNSNVIGVGTGRSKKAAEQMAAKEALRLMGYEK